MAGVPSSTSNIAIRSFFSVISIKDKLFLKRSKELFRIILKKNNNYEMLKNAILFLKCLLLWLKIIFYKNIIKIWII